MSSLHGIVNLGSSPACGAAASRRAKLQAYANSLGGSDRDVLTCLVPEIEALVAAGANSLQGRATQHGYGYWLGVLSGFKDEQQQFIFVLACALAVVTVDAETWADIDAALAILTG